MDEADRMPCPPDFVAAAVIVGLSSVIGARCAIKPKRRDDWLIVPNLWGGAVGLPSDKKSPAIGAGMKPLDRLIAKAMRDHLGTGVEGLPGNLTQAAHNAALQVERYDGGEAGRNAGGGFN